MIYRVINCYVIFFFYLSTNASCFKLARGETLSGFVPCIQRFNNIFQRGVIKTPPICQTLFIRLVSCTAFFYWRYVHGHNANRKMRFVHIACTQSLQACEEYRALAKILPLSRIVFDSSHLCPGLNASIVYIISNSFLAGLFDIFVILHIWQNCECFSDFLPMRTLCDAYHEEFESHQRSILDISEKTSYLLTGSSKANRKLL